MPITTLAVLLPFATIGTAVLQISISARDTQLPLQMPDIRLQANSCPPTIGQSLLAGGVHIRLLGILRSEMDPNNVCELSDSAHFSLTCRHIGKVIPDFRWQFQADPILVLPTFLS